MNPTEPEFGTGALVVLALYLASMLGIGFLARLRRRENTLRDFYLGGSGFGFVVLFLTFFATQYSGNTLLGFAGRSYKQGMSYVVSVTFMILVITVYMIYAPRLFRLSRKFGYITPADYVFHRFGSHALRVIAVLLLCWGLANYILEQLVAMGRAVEALTDHRLGFMQGVLLLVIVMLIYESLGGMRAVAWTDAIQGTILGLGMACFLYILLTSEGGLAGAAEIVRTDAPEKLRVPDWRGIRDWISTLVLLGLGVAVYPHAIQRIYAARSLGTLRRSLAAMSFMPFATTLLAFLVGYIGISRFPGLGDGENDRITIYMLTGIMDRGAFHYWLVVIVSAAVVAAIMSTTDSALLTVQSMLTRDIYKEYIRPGADEREMLRVGKVSGWVMMALLIWMAWISEKTNSPIWFLIKLKLEFMTQISPMFLLGLFWRRLPAPAVLAGVIAGTAVTLVIWCGATAGWWTGRSPWGISAGVWGLALNYAICIIGTRLARTP